MREKLILLMIFIVLALFAYGFDQFDKYLERQAAGTLIIEPQEFTGPDIRYCLKSDYEGDLWDCIADGEYRKQMFRVDI